MVSMNNCYYIEVLISRIDFINYNPYPLAYSINVSLAKFQDKFNLALADL